MTKGKGTQSGKRMSVASGGPGQTPGQGGGFGIEEAMQVVIDRAAENQKQKEKAKAAENEKQNGKDREAGKDRQPAQEKEGAHRFERSKVLECQALFLGAWLARVDHVRAQDQVRDLEKNLDTELRDVGSIQQELDGLEKDLKDIDRELEKVAKTLEEKERHPLLNRREIRELKRHREWAEGFRKETTEAQDRARTGMAAASRTAAMARQVLDFAKEREETFRDDRNRCFHEALTALKELSTEEKLELDRKMSEECERARKETYRTEIAAERRPLNCQWLERGREDLSEAETREKVDERIWNKYANVCYEQAIGELDQESQAAIARRREAGREALYERYAGEELELDCHLELEETLERER